MITDRKAFYSGDSGESEYRIERRMITEQPSFFKYQISGKINGNPLKKKKIRNLKTGKVYDTITEALTELDNWSQQRISSHLTGNTRNSEWEYVE